MISFQFWFQSSFGHFFTVELKKVMLLKELHDTFAFGPELGSNFFVQTSRLLLPSID